MKFLPALAILTTAVFLTAAGIPVAVHYVPHDQVSATMAKTGSPGYIVQDQGLVVLAQRRFAGPVEVHEKTTHVFIIVEGEATEVTGGTLVGGKEISPGQIRGSSIEGGKTHHLTKGDVIVIPANTPHWWKEIPTPTKSIAYYAVNLDLPKSAIPAAVHYVPHDQVSATMAKTGSPGYVVQDRGVVVLAQRRFAGPVEVHEKITHTFIIVEGEATEVTGGTLVDGKQISPGQIRGSSIEGGETHHLSVGDIISIPAKTPHWWKEIPTPTKSIAYYAVNVDFNY